MYNIYSPHFQITKRKCLASGNPCNFIISHSVIYKDVIVWHIVDTVHL